MRLENEGEGGCFVRNDAMRLPLLLLLRRLTVLKAEVAFEKAARACILDGKVTMGDGRKYRIYFVHTQQTFYWGSGWTPAGQ